MTLDAREITQAPRTEWPRYPEYRDSGVEWIGEIPRHWSVSRLRFVACINPSIARDKPDSEAYVSFLPMEKVHENGGLDLDEMRKVSEVERGYTGFRDGDILVAKITPCFENGKGTYCKGLLNGIGFGSTEFHVLRPTSHIDGRLLFYILMSNEFRQDGEASMKGSAGQKRVPEEYLRNFMIALPPISAQQTIAAFLDRETRKLDDLIAKRERLISLLTEKKAALISHAVTRGLDPDTPMKDSGVEWIGKIPEEWKVVALKLLAKIRSGVTKGKIIEGHDAVSVPYLRVANVQDSFIDLSDVAEIRVSRSDAQSFILKTGDVLMNEGGDFDKLGRGAVWDGSIDPCLHQNHVYAVRSTSVEPEWIGLIIRTAYAKHYCSIFSKQSTNLASISSRNVSRLPVVLPPVTTRIQIRKYLNTETGKIDALSHKLEKHISLLRERRSALISAAVTGKIDVRAKVS